MEWCRFRRVGGDAVAVSRIGRGGYRGSVGDQSGTLEAIESIAAAKGPIAGRQQGGGIKALIPGQGGEPGR